MTRVKTKVKKTNTNKRTYIFYLTHPLVSLIDETTPFSTTRSYPLRATGSVGSRSDNFVFTPSPLCGVCMGVRHAGVRAGVCLAVMRVPVLLLYGHLSRRLSCCCAGIRAGVCLAVVLAFAWVSVMLVFVRVSVLLSCGHSSRHPYCCCAGICTGVCLAVVLEFAWASVVLPFALASIVRAGVVYLSHVVGAHVTIRTTVKSIVSN